MFDPFITAAEYLRPPQVIEVCISLTLDQQNILFILLIPIQELFKISFNKLECLFVFFRICEP